MEWILEQMFVRLSLNEQNELYRELLYHFGLVGATDECQALEYAWRDPYNRQNIEEFIRAWLRKRQKQKEAIAYTV
jgi:hypothetical protein